jgi:hypothetical protein
LSESGTLTKTIDTASDFLHLENRIAAYLSDKLSYFKPLLDQGHTASQPSGLNRPDNTPEKITKHAEWIYAKMTSYRFCKKRPEDPKGYLATIQRAVEQHQAIPLIVGHGPQKNPNNCLPPEADWAEFFLLAQLAYLNRVIQAEYAPGLQITLYLDDARAEGANQIPDQRTADYRQSLNRLIETLDARWLFPSVVSLKTLYDEFGVWENVRRLKEHQAVFQASVSEKDLISAAKNFPFALEEFTGLTEEEKTHHIHHAASQYRLYLEAENQSGLWQQPNHLYARFNNHDGFLQLFTLRKGSVTQPWQGQGCLKLTPTGKLEPFVLTQQTEKKNQAIYYSEAGSWLIKKTPLILVSED